jgi:2-oxoglutarate ferredoxin oxidoreductase subunit alpha
MANGPHRDSDTTAVTVQLEGGGGSGVISAGELLARAAARAGLEVFAVRDVPTEVRGGLARFTLRISTRPVHSPGDGADLLVRLDRASDAPDDAIRQGGVILSDAENSPPDGSPADKASVKIPFGALARREAGTEQARNLVALGACAALLGLPLAVLEELVAIRFKDKGTGVVEGNRRALRAGYAGACDGAALGPFLPPWDGPAADRMLLTGNEATALGAIAAGCRFFYGYPITPATEILEVLAARLPPMGGAVVQAEDEMAALGMCLGSAFAGERALTATSGPGFSLMAELLGLSAMAEIPAVVVDVQRGGPSTGLPTKPEQSDLLAAAFGGHGDFPRLVIAPVDVADAFHQTARAFDLAEAYRVPVVVLTDQSIAHRIQTVPRADFAAARVSERPDPAPAAAAGFPGACRRAAGQEHDERGMPDFGPENRERMMRRRFAKLDALPEDACGIETFGDPTAETLVLGWGSTYGAVREAVERLNAAGTPAFAVYPKLLWPYPARLIGERVERARRVIVPEMNYAGQWVRLVEMHHPIRARRFNRFDGRPFAPGELVERIRSAIERDRDPHGAAEPQPNG